MVEVSEAPLPVSHRKRRLSVAAGVIVLVAAGLTVFLLTRGPHAPSASALPRAGGSRIIAQSVTGNFIDETQNGQFRHVALEGQRGESRRILIANEVAAMRQRGWTLQRSTRTVLLKPGTVDYQDVNVAITALGADVDLESHSIYAVLSIARAAHGLNTSYFARSTKPALTRAFQQHRPVLTVTLGDNN